MARTIIIAIKPNLAEAPELVNVQALRHFVLLLSEVVVETETPLRFAANYIHHLFNVSTFVVETDSADQQKNKKTSTTKATSTTKIIPTTITNKIKAAQTTTTTTRRLSAPFHRHTP